MKKVILLLIFSSLFICVGQGRAAVFQTNHYYNYYPNGLANATGTVVATGLNSIEIFNEENKRNETFIILGQEQDYSKGEYIRIYYHPDSAIVAKIMRMTVYQYKRDGQNLGNIFSDNRRK